MVLEELLEIIDQTKQVLEGITPYWEACAIALGTGIAYYIGTKSGAKRERERVINDATYRNDLLRTDIRPFRTQENRAGSNVEEDKDDDTPNYDARFISFAKSHELESKITGKVTEFHSTPDGFSGIIEDSTGKAMFFYDTDFETEEGYLSTDEVGLIPIILQNSMETGNPVTLEAEYDKNTGIFSVEMVRHHIDGFDYRL